MYVSTHSFFHCQSLSDLDRDQAFLNFDSCMIHNAVVFFSLLNKLSLKTKHMIVASQYRIKHLEHQFNIHVDHEPLIRDETYKYL